MTLSLSDLKKNSKKNLQDLTKKATSLNKGYQKDEDDRYWYPDLDKAGNNTCVIRFLPAPKVDGPDGLPWAIYYSHSFKGPTGKWYIENSLSTFKQPDPVGELNSYYWNTVATEDAKNQARRQKRAVNYVCNVLVISDAVNPENNGKVKLFRFGKKIWDMIQEQLTPDEALGEEPCNPFDFWTGKNFKLAVKKVGEYRNYDSSKFASESAISDDDDEIERLWTESHSLAAFTAPENFKSYDALKARLEEVMGATLEELTGKETAPKKSAAPSKTQESKVSRETKETIQEMDEVINSSTDDDDDDFDISKIMADIENDD